MVESFITPFNHSEEDGIAAIVAKDLDGAKIAIYMDILQPYLRWVLHGIWIRQKNHL